MINLILLEGGNSPQKSLLAFVLITLMALIIIGMAAFIGYKAFQPKKTKDKK